MGSEQRDPVQPSDNASSERDSLSHIKSAAADDEQQTSGEVFVNKKFLREEQVQNAVKFLSHPRVRGSPVMYRRSFLERKGLSKEEIDEAFRRMPDSPPNVSGVLEDESRRGTQPDISTLAPQASNAATAADLVVSSKQSRIQWSRSLLTIGVLAASAAGTTVLVTKAVVPRIKSWIHKIVSEENESRKRKHLADKLAEETAAAAKAAAEAAADMARASKDILNSRIDDQKRFESLMALLNVQVQELRSMVTAFYDLEGSRPTSIVRNSDEGSKPPSANGPSDYRRMYPAVQVAANGPKRIDLQTVKPSTAPELGDHRKTFDEVFTLIQRGERPPGIKEINDNPPNPNQAPSNPRIQPPSKPWEDPNLDPSVRFVFQTSVGSESPETLASTPWNMRTSEVAGPTIYPWQRRTVTISEIQPVEEEQSIQRGWVPPRPPTVSVPEAATAIRHQRALPYRDRLADDHLTFDVEKTDEKAVAVETAYASSKVVEDIPEDRTE